MSRHLFPVPHRPFFGESACNGSFSKIGQISGPQAKCDKLPVLRNGQRHNLQTAASRVLHSMIESRKDLQVVADFINKLRTAEDLVSKLGFSLREIQRTRRPSSGARKKRAKSNPKSFAQSEPSNVVRLLQPITAIDSASEDRCR